MNIFKYKKSVSIFILAIILVISYYFFHHYIAYGNSLKYQGNNALVNEKSDIAILKNKEVIELIKIGFSEKEINALKDANLETLTLRDFVSLLELHDNKKVHPENLESSDVYQLLEIKEGVVSINVRPIETIYFNEGGSKTFYTKFEYTVDIKKPMFWQSKDEFKMIYNDWYSLFKYAKLHYTSAKGEVYDQYVTREKASSGVVPFEFAVRQKNDGGTYYLSGISGLAIMKSPHHNLDLYLGYNHKQFITNNIVGEHWSQWNWDVNLDE